MEKVLKNTVKKQKFQLEGKILFCYYFPQKRFLFKRDLSQIIICYRMIGSRETAMRCRRGMQKLSGKRIEP